MKRNLGRLLRWKRLSAGHYEANGDGTLRYNIDRYDPEDGSPKYWLITLEDKVDTDVCEELGGKDLLEDAKRLAEIHWVRS